LELHIGTTPTPDKPQITISYAATVTKTSTVQGHGGTTPFSTVGTTRETPDWPTNSRGYQTIQGSESSQTGSANLEQRAPNWPTARQTGLGLFRRPDPTITSESILGGAQLAQLQMPSPAQQQQPGQAPPASPAWAQGPPGGQLPAGAQGPPTPSG
jgi:hypothetical protein